MLSFTEKSPQVATLELLGPCNYLCWYCVGKRNTMAYPEPELHDLPKLTKIYALLQKRGSVRTTMRARGTEPALHPQIRQIVSLCAAVGPIRIMTNLSIPVTEWLPHPADCTLLVMIHPEAEEDLDGFLDRVREAQELGYHMELRFDSRRMEETDYEERLAVMGIDLLPHQLRTPGAIRERKPGAPKIAGALCTSGYDSVFIRSETILYRCPYNPEPLLELLSGPAPCLRSVYCAFWKHPR